MAEAKLCPECGKEWKGLRCGDTPLAGAQCGDAALSGAQCGDAALSGAQCGDGSPAGPQCGLVISDDRRCRVCGSAAAREPAGLAGTALGVALALPVLAVTAGVAAVIFWLAISVVHSLVSWTEVRGAFQGEGYEVHWHLCTSWLLVALSILILVVMAVSYAVRMNK